MGYNFEDTIPSGNKEFSPPKEPRGGIKKTWQNLIYQKCPVCHTPMEKNRQGFACPNKDECVFFISKRKLGEILTDPTHAAIRFANEAQRELIRKMVEGISVTEEEVRGII